jgi:hypothetical protein
MSDPSGPSPRFTEPGIMDMHISDPRRQGALFISRAVDRVVDLAMSLVSERMIPIMAALDDLSPPSTTKSTRLPSPFSKWQITPLSDPMVS